MKRKRPGRVNSALPKRDEVKFESLTNYRPLVIKTESIFSYMKSSYIKPNITGLVFKGEPGLSEKKTLPLKKVVKKTSLRIPAVCCRPNFDMFEKAKFNIKLDTKI